MKYLKALPLALIATLASQEAIALSQATISSSQTQAQQDAIDRLAAADAAQKAAVKKAAEEAAALAQKKAAEEAAKKAAEEAAAAEKAAAEAAAAEKAAAEAAAKKATEEAAAKKAAEEEAARKAAEAAKKAAEEEAARNAGPEAAALKEAGIEVNDSNKKAVKLLLDLSVQKTFITDTNIKAILNETADLEKRAAALLIKTGLYDKPDNTSKKRGETYSYRHAAEAFAKNEKAWKVATTGDLKYWRKHAGHGHNKSTVGSVANGRRF